MKPHTTSQVVHARHLLALRRWLLVSGLMVCAGAVGLRQAQASQPEAHADAHQPAQPAAAPVHAAPASPAANADKTPDAQTLEAAAKVQALVAKAQARHARNDGSTEHAAPTRVAASAQAGHNDHGAAPATANSRAYIRAKAAALAGRTEPGHTAPADEPAHAGGDVHWSYEGATGPANWSTLKPEFSTCASGQRQSPIHIEEAGTLPGPAEPLQFTYQASSGSVVNNGHTIQVDVQGDNTLIVRGSVYKLVQFHFHHPAEEKVNYKGFSMVVHLVHKNAAGQLAVLAVLMDPGASSPLVDKVWTHMPLDVADRVQLPAGLIQLGELLPQDQRYYQFIGSLTTPPCTEGVLWMVLKQPMTLSRDQLRLFARLFPNNARPTQAANNRIVREAM